MLSSGLLVMCRSSLRQSTTVPGRECGFQGVVAMREESQLQEGVSAVGPDDYARVVEVWEASVRATHTFATEADIEGIRPLVRDGLPEVPPFLGVREPAGQVAGFIGVQEGKVELLFVHPALRGQGVGR